MAWTVETSADLLNCVRDRENFAAWLQFVSLYRGDIYQYCRRNGLQDADAADIVQEVLVAAAKAIPSFEYDRHRGSFRGWLLTVTRNKLKNFFHQKTRREDKLCTFSDHSAVCTASDDEKMFQTRRVRFRRLAAHVRHEFRSSTWKAFWATSVEGQRPAEAAKKLGTTVGAIYVAKSRVSKRLRECAHLKDAAMEQTV